MGDRTADSTSEGKSGVQLETAQLLRLGLRDDSGSHGGRVVMGRKKLEEWSWMRSPEVDSKTWRIDEREGVLQY